MKVIPPDRISVTTSGVQYFLDRVEVTEAEYRRRYPLPKATGSHDASSFIGWREQHARSMSVHPRQIAKAMEVDKKLGVPTEYDAKGRPIYTSRAHRRAHHKAHGRHDNDAGYGDAAG